MDDEIRPRGVERDRTVVDSVAIGMCLRVVAVAALLVTTAAPLVSAAEPTATRVAHPNIVFIIADDLGARDLSCYGRHDQPTPRIDALAAQGMRFTCAYAAQSVCSPTRAAIMTGKAPARLHLTTFLPGRGNSPAQLLLQADIQRQLPLAETTIAEVLKPQGYTSACLGKWHLGDAGFSPTDQGFDFYYPGKASSAPSASEGGKGEYELTAEGEKFIEANRQRPFFLYIGHNCPHVPLSAKPELIEKHRDAFNPIYAAMIETLDDCVGRIAAKIDSLGLAERTLFIFTSDNGGLHVLEGATAPATSNRPLRAGKGFCYEGGLRIPLVVRWPGVIQAGAVSDVPVISTDWLPTIAALTAATLAAPLDGVSLDRLLTQGESPAARPLYWHLPHYTNQGSRPSGAIRDAGWKLIEHYEDGRCELFDLDTDPSEATDLSAERPAQVAELRGKLEAWRRAVGAQENGANPEFNGPAWRKLYQDSIDVARLPADETATSLAAAMSPWRGLMDEAVSRPRRTAIVNAGPGAMILQARDAKVHGEKLRHEAEPHKDTLGFWVVPSDWAEWQFDAPAAGSFDVELLAGCGKGSGGAQIEIAAADQALTTTIAETGHFQRFVPRRVGTLNLPKPGRYSLTVKAISKPGPAVMDLRRITLRAAAGD